MADDAHKSDDEQGEGLPRPPAPPINPFLDTDEVPTVEGTVVEDRGDFAVNHEPEPPVEGSPVPEPPTRRPPTEESAPPLQPEEPEGESVFKEVWKILDQAGVSPRKLGIGCGVALFVIVVLLVIIFWNGDESAPEQPTEEPTEEEDESTPVEADGRFDYPLVTSYLYGLSFAPESSPVLSENPGVRTAFIYGVIAGATDDPFVFYVDTIRQLHSIFTLDVYALLDETTARREALDEYIQEYERLLAVSETNFQRINEQLVRLESDFAEISAIRDAREQEFFLEMQEFEGRSAVTRLNAFIDAGKNALAVKARFNAFRSLRDNYVTVLQRAKPRLVDVRANSEALIKGIRVFEVPGSDIDAIVPLRLQEEQE